MTILLSSLPPPTTVLMIFFFIPFTSLYEWINTWWEVHILFSPYALDYVLFIAVLPESHSCWMNEWLQKHTLLPETGALHHSHIQSESSNMAYTTTISLSWFSSVIKYYTIIENLENKGSREKMGITHGSLTQFYDFRNCIFASLWTGSLGLSLTNHFLLNSSIHVTSPLFLPDAPNIILYGPGVLWCSCFPE